MPQKPRVKKVASRVYSRLPVGEIVKRAGGPVSLSRILGITSSAISQWRQIPVRHALRVAEVADVPLSLVRPDVYGIKAAEALRNLVPSQRKEAD